MQVQTAAAAYDRNRIDEMRSKDLVVRFGAVHTLRQPELFRLAKYLDVAQSSRETGTKKTKTLPRLAREVKETWEAQISIHGERIVLPPPPEMRGTAAPSWKSIAK